MNSAGVSPHSVGPTTSSLNAINHDDMASSPLPNGNRALHINTGSSLLNDEMNQRIFAVLGQNSFTLSSGMVQLLEADAAQWRELEMGVLCYVRDYRAKCVSLRLIDPGFNNNLPIEKWRLIIPPEGRLAKKHSNLVTFCNNEGELFGFNFSAEFEARDFFNKVQFLQTERQRKLHEKRERDRLQREAAAEQNSSPGPVQLTKVIEMGEEENAEELMRQAILSASRVSDSSKPANNSKRLFSPFTTMMDNAMSSIRQSVPSRLKAKSEKKKKKKKSKKEKPDRLVIGQPTDFVHVAHFGEGAFCEDDVDETVREVYRVLNFDYNGADPRELASIRRRVSSYGPDIVRQSIRRKARAQLPNGHIPQAQQNGDFHDAGLRAANMHSSLTSIRGPRDSLRLPPRDSGRATPNSVKHFDEIKRRESGKKEPGEGRRSRTPPGRSSPPAIARKPPNLALKANLPNHRASPTSLRSSSSMTGSDIAISVSTVSPTSRSPNPQPISPISLRSNEDFTERPPPLPASSPPPLIQSGRSLLLTCNGRPPVSGRPPRHLSPPSEGDTAATIASSSIEVEISNGPSRPAVAFGFDNNNLARPALHDRRNAIDLSSTTSGSLANGHAGSSGPPPAPPLPPKLSNASSANVATSQPPTTSAGRQDLLQAIRQADKSALRKVSPSTSETNPVTPLSESNNLLDVLRLTIERRREGISDSSDESDEESSNGEWEDES